MGALQGSAQDKISGKCLSSSGSGLGSRDPAGEVADPPPQPPQSHLGQDSGSDSHLSVFLLKLLVSRGLEFIFNATKRKEIK